VDEETIEALNAPMTMGELEVVLRCFEKDKSHGPDGWPVEFYLTFF